MADTHPLYIPAPYQDSAESGRLILRDGSASTVRVATPGDEKDVAEFFHRLSPESRRQRFFSSSEPSHDLIRSLCDSSHPEKQLTLLVERVTEGGKTIVATGS